MTSKSGPKAVMNELADNKIFTEETITNYMKARGWKKEKLLNPDYWLNIKLGFKFNNFSLSIIAGDNSYSTPREKSEQYTAVEIGLLNSKGLIYLKENAKYFRFSKVEGYIGWDKFKQIVEFVETLKCDGINNFPKNSIEFKRYEEIR